ncbi:MAG: 1,4-alpha-glucan branching protein GlgB [Gammaproteobacteria bacterium]
MAPKADGTGAAAPEDAARRIAAGQHVKPFAFLGAHPHGAQWIVRTFAPGATAASLVDADGAKTPMQPAGADGVFDVVTARMPESRRIEAENPQARWTYEDPFRFGPVLGELDEHLLGEGTHWRLWEVLGAHVRHHEKAQGVAFAVWAPHARRVSVVGDFNDWDGRRHVMRRRGASGIWEIFAPGVAAGARYKYEVLGADGTLLPPKADPLGFAAELRPDNCSVVSHLPERGAVEAARRPGRDGADVPMSIYEVHLSSWRRGPAGRPLSWRELGEQLPDYAKDLGFTHIEVLPVSEHPFDGSWGYQPIGLFAPTSRHGDAAGFADFVAACHDAGLGLILDWVPAHFPSDAHGLARFDGTALYEHADPRQGLHRDWGTLIYNFGRTEVANFLIANALYWIKVFGVDGLRVDAVASMLYRDYSREAGEWVPNVHGGRENLEAVDFIRRLNARLREEAPQAITIAEESTAWPGVTRSEAEAGLGFGWKWNMGWMNDTLAYMAEDPMHRGAHHAKMTFGFHYAFSERFILPLSHDEVVHGKRTILGRMPGDRAAKFANLRAYYAFMWAHPGKKLLFMGQEFGQETEWSHDGELPFGALADPLHGGVQNLVRDLNRLHRESPALHRCDTCAAGFEWIDGAADEAAVIAFARKAPGAAPVIALFNFSGVERRDWRFGAPAAGRWRRVIDTADAAYGGPGTGPEVAIAAQATPSHGMAQSICVTLAPLSGALFEHTAE